ncbi:MAG: Mov34/MPN/PAD-1 family protein [bacterium]
MAWKVKGKETVQGLRCSLVEIDKVHVEPIPREKVELLLKEYPHQEWMAYLVGKKLDNTYRVLDIVVPPHAYVGAGMAEAEPFNIPENCIGVIHSHHSMGAFHSGTDHDHVDRNYPISITVAKQGGADDWDISTYAVTPCDKAVEGKSEVMFLKPKPLFSHKEFLAEAKFNIIKGKGSVVGSGRQGKVEEKQVESALKGEVPIRYLKHPGMDVDTEHMTVEEYQKMLGERGNGWGKDRRLELPDDEYQAMSDAFEQEEQEELRAIEEEEEAELEA